MCLQCPANFLQTISLIRYSYGQSPVLSDSLLSSGLSSGKIASANMLATLLPIQELVQGSKMMETILMVFGGMAYVVVDWSLYG